jgi:LmbE family N-acetylglucosaminyl deacetylase
MSGLVVISPHLDDGVFACGGLLARHPGSVVVTALAGGPGTGDGVTEWDAAGGFTSSAEAVAARREEDREALAVLDAAPVWLDFPDSQYGGTPSIDVLADALSWVVSATVPAAVLFPLGLFHSDHTLTYEASVRALERDPGPARLIYEDAIYRRFPGLRDERLDALARAGRRLQFAGMVIAPVAKRAAVVCYRSQLRALSTPGRPGYDDAFAAECYWRLL